MRLIRDLLALLIAGLILGAIVAEFIVDSQDAVAKDRCFSAAGRVEHYDGDRPDVWRCVGANMEGR